VRSPERRITERTKIGMRIGTAIIIIGSLVSGVFLYANSQNTLSNAINKCTDKNYLQDVKIELLEKEDVEKQGIINSVITTQTKILTNQDWIIKTLDEINNKIE